MLTLLVLCALAAPVAAEELPRPGYPGPFERQTEARERVEQAAREEADAQAREMRRLLHAGERDADDAAEDDE